MAHSGYDLFIAPPDSGEERQCQVCGTDCRALRNVFGPTGFASAIAKQFTHHDEFVCPHTDESWHEQALQLKIEIAQTPSKRLAGFMQADLEDLLQANR